MTDLASPTDILCKKCGHLEGDHRQIENVDTLLCFHKGVNGKRFCNCLGYEASPPPSELFLAYVAGFFDGEGCVTILRQQEKHRASMGYRLHTYITQKYKSPLVTIVSGMGYGKVYKMKGVTPSWDAFQLQFTGVEAVRFLKAILPHLILKRNQALYALEYFENTKWSRADGYRVSDEMNALRESYYKRLQAMKKESDDE